MLLDLQKNIEEKRLILGQKIEKFLLTKLLLVVDFWHKILAAKSCAFYGSLVIVLLSILIRSSRDIGHDSAAYLDIAAKMLAGGKYYSDFFESNFPLSFCLTMIPVFLAKILSISPIIAAEIFINLLGILAIFSAAKILSKASFAKDQTAYNLVILAFSTGFFLRVFTLQFNEFLTKASYLLICAFPYIAYQFFDVTKLKKSDRVLIGILAALIFCLKPHYGILVIVFEVTKLLEKKSFKPAFSLQNSITLAVLLLYVFCCFKFFPEFIAAIPQLSDSYYSSNQDNISLAELWMLREDLFPVFLVFFFSAFLWRKNLQLRPFFLASCASAILIMSEMIAGFDQRSVFYALSLPLLLLIARLIIQNKIINWKRDGIVLTMLFLVPQFDQEIFSTIIFNSGIFWWVMVLILSAKWRENLPQKIDKKWQFLLPHNMVSWLYFVTLTVITIFLISQKENGVMSWIFVTFILVLMLVFYQKLYEQNSRSKEFHILTAAAVTLVFSYFFSLLMVGIFNLHYFMASDYKSPNYTNEQVQSVIKNYADGLNDEITIISTGINATYPSSIYAKKTNHLPSLHLSQLYQKISTKQKMSQADEYLFLRVKSQMARLQNKLVFIEKNRVAPCFIDFAEYYSRDSEFKKIFLHDYRFLTSIIRVKKIAAETKFFDEDKTLEAPQSNNIIDREIEVYIRKND